MGLGLGPWRRSGYRLGVGLGLRARARVSLSQVRLGGRVDTKANALLHQPPQRHLLGLGLGLGLGVGVGG